MLRQEIVTEARRYLEKPTPWRHRGRSIMGVDCIGLVCVVGDTFGIAYEDVDGYSRNPDGRFVEHVKKHMTFRLPQTPAPGSVAIIRDAHQPCHIGIISEKYGQLHLIHASLPKRGVVEEVWEGYWSSKVRCYLDFPGVED